MSAPIYFAHSLKDRPLDEWQRLEEHLSQTAALADIFAEPFAPGWGRLAGLWHDAGKYQLAFQHRIGVEPDIHVNDRVDHSTVGALIARQSNGAALLAFVVAGHHGGLPDADALAARLAQKSHLLKQTRDDGLPRWIEDQTLPPPPIWLTQKLQMSLWTRFLFSALVDADFLDTERFYAGGRVRDLGVQLSLAELKLRLDQYIRAKAAASPKTAMNQLRARVLEACRSKASLDPGLFTLTVPTGGGKTLASLAFALDHAVNRGMSRVIVVIPYTSIIEQTAAVYREALGEASVVEHHTNTDPDKETPANRLASENWDAPIVVTTSVQFFESLYANRPSRCRKLHRIANSVVVFDEVQTFPVELLAPVRHVLQELSENYRASLVFCTATQPTLFQNAREILPDPAREFAAIANRCDIILPATDAPVTWEALAAELRNYRQVLAIVHRRGDAQHLAELAGQDCLHLSARMCARHRSRVLDEVKRRLKAGEDCRLVATQLVEAGVDIDFPEVYRAFAGADSLAQAAGRCNREGHGTGRLHIFFPPTMPPRGILRTAQAQAKIMWRQGRLELKLPGTFVEYFDGLYRSAEQDARAVLAAENDQHFKQVADLFRMIDDAGQPVVAPFGDWQKRVDDIRNWGISRERMRRLQPLLVSLYPQEIDVLRKAGAIEKVEDIFWTPHRAFRIYSQRWGFGWQGQPAAEPENLIV